MKRHFKNLSITAARAVRHWWLMFVAGILCIALGVAVFVFPLASYVTLAILMGVLMLLTGIVQLVLASTSSNYIAQRGYMIVAGILDIIFGVFLCMYPGITMVMLPVIMGIWMMYRSLVLIAFGGDVDTFRLGRRGFIVAGGVLLLLLSVLVILNPFSIGVGTIILIAGAGLLLLGCLLCALSIKMKNIDKLMEEETAV
jgi:uncharacterized membrane protein HdeD (DUF308 family)